MKIKILEAGKFKLDGGAMFGVVPRSMWSKLNPPDEGNMCTWSTRLLLVETGERKIIFDCGLGLKQEEKFFSHFHPHEGNVHEAIDNYSIDAGEITDVFLTHLHFDHCGGALFYDENREIKPTFPNATYWSNQTHFDWAYTPNPREKASFLKENFVPLRDLGLLNFIPVIQGVEWLPGIKIWFYYGHTEAMMVPEIIMPDGSSVYYAADLLPSSYHVRLPYVMSYDIRPLKCIDEKLFFYNQLESRENHKIIFEHDPVNPVGFLTKDDRGRFKIETQVALMT